MNKPYPGVLMSSTNIQTFKLEGTLPSGTIILIDWTSRTINLEYPPDTPSLPDSSYRNEYKKELLAYNNPETDLDGYKAAAQKGAVEAERLLAARKAGLAAKTLGPKTDPEPELPMGQTTIVDPTKDRKYTVMDADGWTHAPNGTGITATQKRRNSPLIILIEEVAKLIDKEKVPVCCFALAYARGATEVAPTISGMLSQLFERGMLRRQKYHCGCRGCLDVSDGRTIFHYQLMPGGGK